MVVYINFYILLIVICNYHSIFCIVFMNLLVKCCSFKLQKNELFCEHFGSAYNITQQGIGAFK